MVRHKYLWVGCYCLVVQGFEFYAAIAWNFCRWFCGYLLFVPVVALSVGRERFMRMGGIFWGVRSAQPAAGIATRFDDMIAEW
ncbi:hypothetical protein [Microcoleus sp. CAWBG640]|uniref:hypothetical protein n=1 Tax=Microcoleus sp. CAWBG640 TaxID=2841653 RepID=UPI00312B4235